MRTRVRKGGDRFTSRTSQLTSRVSRTEYHLGALDRFGLRHKRRRLSRCSQVMKGACERLPARWCERLSSAVPKVTATPRDQDLPAAEALRSLLLLPKKKLPFLSVLGLDAMVASGGSLHHTTRPHHCRVPEICTRFSLTESDGISQSHSKSENFSQSQKMPSCDGKCRPIGESHHSPRARRGASRFLVTVVGCATPSATAGSTPIKSRR